MISAASSGPEFGRGGHMKKIGFLTLVMFAALLIALTFPVAASGPQVPATAVAAVPAPTPAPAAIAAAMPEGHPHIHEALEAMRDAKHHLEGAEHDFHGHRVKAIEHLNQAIREAEICESEP
jgi:hypothetical protein